MQKSPPGVNQIQCLSGVYKIRLIRERLIDKANLCKPIHEINYSTSICPFESKKFGKEGKHLQRFEYLENKKSFFHKKSFFDEIKNISHSFLKAIVWWKNKNLIKIAYTSFKKDFVPLLKKSFWISYIIVLKGSSKNLYSPILEW